MTSPAPRPDLPFMAAMDRFIRDNLPAWRTPAGWPHHIEARMSNNTLATLRRLIDLRLSRDVDLVAGGDFPASIDGYAGIRDLIDLGIVRGPAEALPTGRWGRWAIRPDLDLTDFEAKRRHFGRRVMPRAVDRMWPPQRPRTSDGMTALETWISEAALDTRSWPITILPWRRSAEEALIIRAVGELARGAYDRHLPVLVSYADTLTQYPAPFFTPKQWAATLRVHAYDGAQSPPLWELEEISALQARVTLNAAVWLDVEDIRAIAWRQTDLHNVYLDQADASKG